jgi:hypothetical protein
MPVDALPKLLLAAAIFVSKPSAGADSAIELEATPPPFRYTIPWQLRPLPAPTVVRLDTVVGVDEDRASRRGMTLVSFLTAAARVPGTGPPRAGLDIIARGGFVTDSPPTGSGGSAIANLMLGAAYAVRLPSDFLFNFFLGFTLPVGSGGGDAPDPGAVAARSRGAAARSGLDNALLATNDVGVAPGVSFGWVSHGWTLQIEGTLSHVVRVRGAHAQREASKTNSALGIHVGYFLVPFLSLNSEARYQRWVNPPFNVEADATRASIDTVTVAVGPRIHIETSAGWLRPGIAYVRALDKPLAASSPNLHVVQIDIPFVF